MKPKNFWGRLCPHLPQIYIHTMTALLLCAALAGLMSAVAVIGLKLSGNQHKADQAWDWLKRIWVAWAIIVTALQKKQIPSFEVG